MTCMIMDQQIRTIVAAIALFMIVPSEIGLLNRTHNFGFMKRGDKIIFEFNGILNSSKRLIYYHTSGPYLSQKNPSTTKQQQQKAKIDPTFEINISRTIFHKSVIVVINRNIFFKSCIFLDSYVIASGHYSYSFQISHTHWYIISAIHDTIIIIKQYKHVCFNNCTFKLKNDYFHFHLPQTRIERVLKLCIKNSVWSASNISKNKHSIRLSKKFDTASRLMNQSVLKIINVNNIYLNNITMSSLSTTGMVIFMSTTVYISNAFLLEIRILTLL